MALFKKREDLDIPRIPSLPDFPTEQRERELPSLPKGLNEEINRDIIKSAIGEDFSSDEPQNAEEGGIPSPPAFNSDHERFLPQERMAPSIMEPPKRIEERSPIEGPDSIFVRIDKFRAAKRELANVKKNLLEAEAIINKIREIKTKEDGEIGDINLNLDNIKKKISEVDSLVFDKV
jgi:hypothetical protein